MRRRYLSGTYIEQESPLHHLHISLKLGLLCGYVLVLVTVNHPIALTVLMGTLLLAIRLNGSAQPRPLPLLILAALILSIHQLVPSQTELSVLTRVLVLLFKLALLNRLLQWYGQTTPLADTLQWVQRQSHMRWLQELSFLASTTLSVQPGIRHDIMSTIDAERLRTGKRPLWFGWGTWLDILTNTLVHALQRGRDISQSALERGFSLSGPFTPLHARSITTADWQLALLGLVPGIISVGVSILL